MPTFDISYKEKEAIIIGLNMRRAYIETGDPCVTAESAKKMGKPEMIVPLTVDQMELIILMEGLITKLYSK